MEALVNKQKRKIVRNGQNGIGTTYWLDHGQDGLFNTLQFQKIEVRKRPENNIYVCIFQFRNNGSHELIKLPFDDFIQTYGINKKSVTFQSYSKLLFEISINLGNELIMLSDERKIDFGWNPGAEKVKYSELNDFEFEMTYELY
jgi:hypothetical protein